MPFFHKKPVTIEAHRWFKNGDHPKDYVEDQYHVVEGKPAVITAEERRSRSYEGEVVRYFRHPRIEGTRKCDLCNKEFNAHGWIDRGINGIGVCPGDWVITLKGASQEFAVAKDSAFKALYLEVNSRGEPVLDQERESHLWNKYWDGVTERMQKDEAGVLSMGRDAWIAWDAWLHRAEIAVSTRSTEDRS